MLRWQKSQHNLTPIDLDWLHSLIGPCGLLLVGFDFLNPRFMFIGEAWNL